MALTEEGLVLGVTLLAKREAGELRLREPRLLALLGATYLEPPPEGVMGYIRHAEKAYARKDAVGAAMALALSGVKRLASRDQARQLAVADKLLRKGMRPHELLSYVGFGE